MLKIIIPASESYDEIKEEFIYKKEQILYLEHSLISISKWESKWCKPYLKKGSKTTEEALYYVYCMVVSPKEVDENIARYISSEDMIKIKEYIESDMTATTFANNGKNSINKEIITSELIYYWMIALQIPFECQKWHLNRLITLINVTNIKNNPPKKMTQAEIMARNNALNAKRKAELGING